MHPQALRTGVALGPPGACFPAMKYEITGANGFKASAPDAATALIQVKAAILKFSPIEIDGPGGRLSLAILERRAWAERHFAVRP